MCLAFFRTLKMLSCVFRNTESRRDELGSVGRSKREWVGFSFGRGQLRLRGIPDYLRKSLAHEYAVSYQGQANKDRYNTGNPKTAQDLSDVSGNLAAHDQALH